MNSRVLQGDSGSWRVGFSTKPRQPGSPAPPQRVQRFRGRYPIDARDRISTEQRCRLWFCCGSGSFPALLYFVCQCSNPVGAGIDQSDHFGPFLRRGFTAGEISDQHAGILVRQIAPAPFNLGAGACKKLGDDFEISLHLLFNKRTRIRRTLAKLTAQLLVYCIAQLHNFTPVQASRRI